MEEMIIEEKVIEGDIEAKDKRMVFIQDCLVGGNIVAEEIKAKGNLMVGGYVEVSDSIDVKGYLRIWRDLRCTKWIEVGKFIITGGGPVGSGGSVEVEGSLEAKEFILIDGSLKVGNNVETNGFVEALSDIKIDGYLRAKEHIISRRGAISVRWSIDTDGIIVAAESIDVGEKIVAKSIFCQSIRAGESIMAEEIIEVENKIFAGLKAEEKDGSECIFAREFRGKIGHGTLILEEKTEV